MECLIYSFSRKFINQSDFRTYFFLIIFSRFCQGFHFRINDISSNTFSKLLLNEWQLLWNKIIHIES